MAQSYYCREPEVRTTLAASPIANFGFASVLRFRSSLSSVRQTQANFGIGTLKRDGFSSNRHPALGYCWSMMFSENRYPLSGIMLLRPTAASSRNLRSVCQPVERKTAMTISVGDRVPAATFRMMTPDGPAPKTSDDIFKGKKVVLFAVPGAFTPTCHKNHMPGFVKNADAIKAKGIDTIAVTAVNDVFVMDAWKKASGAEG